VYEYIRYTSLLRGQIAIIHDDLTLTCALHIYILRKSPKSGL